MTAPVQESPPLDAPQQEAARPSLWHNRDFVTFWSGETLSLFGAQITALGLPLTAVLTLGSGPQQLGLIKFLQMVPYLVFGPVFGVWVDQHRRRPAMLLANSVRMVLIGAVPLLYWLGRLNSPLLLGITFGVSSAAVLFDVSWMSFIPSLVKDRAGLVEANAKLGASASAADASGPGVAGVLISVLAAPGAMVVNAVTYFGSVVSLLLMRTPEPQPPTPAERRALLTELADGLRFVVGNRHLRAVAVVGGACNLVIAATEPIFVLYAVRSRGVPASALGLVLSIGAAGGVVGALSAGRLINRLPPGRVYVLALCLAFPSLLLIPLAGGPRLAVEALFTLAFFVSLSGIALVNVLILTLRQTITPPAFLGRMNAAMRAVMFGLGAVGGPAAGVLAVQFGLRTTLWVFGAAGVAFTVSAFFSPVARLREMPAPLPAPGARAVAQPAG